MRRIVLVVAVFMMAALLAGPGPAAAAVAPTISGPAVVARSATVVISGHAGAGQPVQVWFHQAGEPAGYYSLRRSLTADSRGGFRTSYLADTDYRYYASSGGANSPVHLTQAAFVTISGPGNANRGASVAISGTVHPATAIVNVYFHRSGEPAGHYSLRRQLHADGAGRWSTSYVEDTDYRYYATSPGSRSANVLTRVSPPWLQAVNAYRVAYGLGPVYQNDALSAADAVHVRYMHLTGQLGHFEDPANKYYTPTGDAAAGRSNVAGGWGTTFTDVGWVNLWMNGPFHEIGLLRPTLNTVGFASGSGDYGTYAALDVLGDLSRSAPGGWPKSFPSAAAPFPFREYTRNEIPDPAVRLPGRVRAGHGVRPVAGFLGPGRGLGLVGHGFPDERRDPCRAGRVRPHRVDLSQLRPGIAIGRPGDPG